MTGEKIFPSVMDTILDDKIYFSLFAFLERCNNFFGNNKTMIFSDFSEREHTGGTTLEVHNDTFYFGTYRTADTALKITNQSGWINTASADLIIVYPNATSTDLSPLKAIPTSRNSYDEFGWMIRDHVITDEMHSDLFQFSTVHDVYNPEEIQEVMNRLRNLPLKDVQRLEFASNFRHSVFNSNLDTLLKGY